MRRGRSHSWRAACVPPGITHLPPPQRRRSSAASAQLGEGGGGGGGASLEYLGLAFLPGMRQESRVQESCFVTFCCVLFAHFQCENKQKKDFGLKSKGCYCVIFHDELDGSRFSFLTRRHPSPSTRFQRPAVSRAARRSARG